MATSSSKRRGSTTPTAIAPTVQDLILTVRSDTIGQALTLADPNGTAPTKKQLTDLLELFHDSPQEWDQNGDALLNVLDRKLTECIDASVSAVLHHPTVAGLRGRWSAVEQLFAEPMLPPDFRLNILQATPAGLTSQLRAHGGDIEKTPVYKHLALAAYGSIPYLAVEFDHALSNGKQDMDLLHLTGRLGEKGLFMCLVNISPVFFGLDTFDLPTDGKGMRGLFKTAAMSRYEEFRKQSHARFVAPCFPGAYSVVPFSRDDNPAESFDDFTEDIKTEADLVTVGAAGAMLYCISRSIGTTGWPAAIVGEDWGGKIAGLVVQGFSTATGEERGNAATQMIIYETIELPLVENGITALVAKVNSTIAAFFAGATASRVVRGLDPNKSHQSAMAASLPNMLVTLRLSHYLKALHRKLLGSQKGPKDVENGLQTWANRLVTDQADASDRARSERPFRKIIVEVQKNAGMPGYLTVTVTLIPHFRISAVQGAITFAPDQPGNDVVD